MSNGAMYRSPSKVRSKRQNMTEFFCDEIPTRDDTPSITQQKTRRHSTAIGSQVLMNKSTPSIPIHVSPIRRDERVLSATNKASMFAMTHVDGRRSVKDICKSFSDDCTTDSTVSSRSTTPSPKHPCSSTHTQSRPSATATTTYPSTPPSTPPKPAYSKRSSTSQHQSQTSSDTESGRNYQVLSRNIYNMWQSQQLCDVIINAGGRSFPVHKLVMAASCGLFPRSNEQTHELNVVELDIPDVSADAMEDVIRFFYTFKLTITSENIESVIKIGQYLGIKSVIDMCKQFLSKVSLENIVYNRYVAQKHNLTKTVSTIDRFLNENFQKLVKTTAFLHSDFQHVYSIISSDLCIAPKELQIFHACASWVDFNRQERTKYVVPLMSIVRFVHISPEDLVSQVESMCHFFEIPECKDMLYNAFRHHALFREFLPSAILPMTPRHAHAPGTTAPPTTPSRIISDTKQTTQSSPVLNEHRASTTMSPISPATTQCSKTYAGGGDSPQETSDDVDEENAESDATETTKWSDMPPPPGRPVLLVFGGVHPKNSHPETMDIGQAVQQYDPKTNAWSVRTHMPFPVHHCGTAVVDNAIYVIGGSRSSLTDDNPNVTSICYKYNADVNEWVCIAPMRIARTNHAVVTLCGVIYAVGGKDQDGTALDSVEFYNYEEDMWQFTQSMNEARVGLAAASHKGRLFVLGGVVDPDDKELISTVETYDPKTDNWNMLEELPAAICKARLVDINGVLFLVGGQVFRNGVSLSVDSVFRYRDDTDSWEGFQKLRIPRHDASVAVFGSKMFIVGGISSSTWWRGLTNVECLDVETGKHVEEIAPLMTATFGLACCTFSGSSYSNTSTITD